MGKLYEENWFKKWKNGAILGKFPRVYRYRYRAVPVQPTRGQGVLIQVCPKCPECCIFVYLSLNSYSVSIGTLLNELR